MSDNFFEIETSNLGNTIATLTSQLDKLRSANARLLGHVQELDSTWEGPTKTEFLSQFAKDHETMDQLCEIIESLIQSMQAAKEQYESCEGAVSEAIAAIQISD